MLKKANEHFYNKQHCINVAGSNTPAAHDHKPGGVMMVTQGTTIGRITKIKQNEMGR